MKPVYIVLIVLGAIILIVGLPIAFVTFTWFKVSNTLEDGQSQITQSNNCDMVILNPTKATKISEGVYEIEIKRLAGEEEIGGMFLNFYDKEGGAIQSNPQNTTIPGDIKKLSTKTVTVSDVEDGLSKIEVAVYFLDKWDYKKGCPTSGSLEIA